MSLRRLRFGRPVFAFVLAASLYLGGRGAAFAQDEPVKKGWETTLAAGATLTRGNSETFLGTLSLDAKREWKREEILLGLNAAYGAVKVDGDSAKIAEEVRGFGHYRRLLDGRIYGGLRIDGEYDRIAGFSYRVSVSPLLGYYIVKNPRTSLSLEAGPSVVFENLNAEPSTVYPGLHVGERFEHKLTETTEIWQSLQYTRSVEQHGDKYLLTAELGIDTAITRKLSLRVVLEDNYESEPSAGRKQNNIRFVVGVALKL